MKLIIVMLFIFNVMAADCEKKLIRYNINTNSTLSQIDNNKIKKLFLEEIAKVYKYSDKKVIEKVIQWEDKMFKEGKDPIIPDKIREYHAGMTPDKNKKIKDIKNYMEIINLSQGYYAYVTLAIIIDSIDENTIKAFRMLVLLDQYSEIKGLK